MNIFSDYKIKSKIFLTAFLLYFSEYITSHSEGAKRPKNPFLSHFLDFSLRSRWLITKIRNIYFFIFIFGLKRVKLPLHSISKLQNFIHNLLIFHHSNLFSPSIILIVHRLSQAHFEWLNVQKSEQFTRAESVFEHYSFYLQGFWMSEVRFLYLGFYFQNEIELVILERCSRYILRWKNLNLKLEKFTKRKASPTSVILRL